jgi:hypothetical protein
VQVPQRRPSRFNPAPPTPGNKARVAAFWLELQHQNALRREAEQQPENQNGSGRRTRKNKKQNRRRTRK